MKCGRKRDFKVLEETREKMRKVHKRKQFGFCERHKINLGRKHTEETKLKMGKSRKHKKHSIKTKKKISKSMIGHIVLAETALKISKTLTGKSYKSGVSGKNHWNWKGGISPIRIKVWHSKRYKRWREKVFKRDNWTCQECGARSKKNKYVRIEAHHIKAYAIFPKLRFIVANGITLCKKCHSKKPKGKEIFNITNKLN